MAVALEYLARGWSVVPLCPHDHRGPLPPKHVGKCKSKGKGAIPKWKPLQFVRATESRVREWWAKWPDANLGVIMGTVSSMVAFDIDDDRSKSVV